MSDNTDLAAAIAKALKEGAGAGGENADARRNTDQVVTENQTHQS